MSVPLTECDVYWSRNFITTVHSGEHTVPKLLGDWPFALTLWTARSWLLPNLTKAVYTYGSPWMSRTLKWAKREFHLLHETDLSWLRSMQAVINSRSTWREKKHCTSEVSLRYIRVLLFQILINVNNRFDELMHLLVQKKNWMNVFTEKSW